MCKFGIILFGMLLLSGKVFSQTKEYKLLDKTLSADIPKRLPAVIDTTAPGMALLDNVFKPVKGKYTVYRFIATYQGMSFTGKQKEFHDILIVRTDKKNKILLAYQYTLEWSDVPSETDLYISTCRDTYLVNNLPVDRFRFERPHYYNKNDNKLKDSGKVVLLNSIAANTSLLYRLTEFIGTSSLSIFMPAFKLVILQSPL